MCQENSYMTTVMTRFHGDDSFGVDDSGITAIRFGCRYQNWGRAGGYLTVEDLEADEMGEYLESWTTPPNEE